MATSSKQKKPTSAVKVTKKSEPLPKPQTTFKNDKGVKKHASIPVETVTKIPTFSDLMKMAYN